MEKAILLVLGAALFTLPMAMQFLSAEDRGRRGREERLHLAQQFVRRQLDPVLRVGGPGAWDDGSLSCFTILKDDNRFYLWYGGRMKGKPTNIGLATSSDGILWTKSEANPLFPGGMPYVVKVGNLFYMYYNRRGPLALATSSDGVKWKHRKVPVLRGSIMDPCVLVDEGKFYLWYCGDVNKAYRVCMATSDDGVNWTKVSEPVLPLGKKSEFDEFFHAGPVVLKIGEMYYMWFLGNGYAGTKHRVWRLGFATSADGFTWKKSKANPILDVGAPGSWDDGSFMSVDVLFIDGRFHLWYAGIKKEDVAKEEKDMTIEIGYAVSES